MQCSQCGTDLTSEDAFCPSCGVPTADGSKAPTVALPDDVASRFSIEAVEQQLRRVARATYDIQGVLGQGGMGAVFLARERKLDRLVAIKVLAPALSADRQFVTRFEREARTAASLDHPNIVPIYAIGDEGDLFYFAMKYVAGSSLGEEIRRGPMEFRRVQRLLWDCACALGHAHQRGVVHRDIKPGNIMIDEAGRPAITDFGIAKAIQTDIRFTATGATLGTPTYMSPEQTKGMAVDGRTDEYALAMVGYEMLTGRVPFEEQSLHSLMYKQMFENPPDIQTLRADTPPHLAEAIHRGMEKEPRERYATLEEFATAVWPEQPVSAATVPALEDISVYGPDEPHTPRRRPPSRPPRRSTPVVAAVAAGVVLAGAGAWLALGSRTGSSVGVDSLAAIPAQGESVASADAPVVPVPVPAQSGAAPASAPTQAPSQSPAAERPAARSVGYLSVGARPWGTVFIDGVEIRSTPLTQHELPPGRYVIEIQRLGYVSTVDTVIITAGNTTRIAKTLIPQS